MREQSRSRKLKLCPFCGGTAKVHQAYDSKYAAECASCGARTRFFDSRSAAANAWNNRVEWAEDITPIVRCNSCKYWGEM